MASTTREANELLGGTSTATRSTVTAFNVAMTVVLLAALPPLVYYMWMCLELNHGALMIPGKQMLAWFPMPTLTSVGIVAGWLLFQAGLQVYAPGKWIEGTPLVDGTRLKYRMNGWFSWWFTWAVIAGGAIFGLFKPTALADNLGALLTSVNLFAYCFSFYVYWWGRKTGTEHERTTTNAVCDFLLGTALNPRVGSFDLKLFFEARPGLIAWVAIDLSLAFKQYAEHGTVTVPMILICFFQFWYVADYYFHEEAILSTWDIKHENFGWMLCWGDLVWVPFTYTIQAQYLVSHTHDLPWWGAVGIVVLNFLGFAIFRGTNLQKHHFRKDPERPIWGKPAAYIKTEQGPFLLVSGWWGLSRHMNYFGDLLMGLAWCLPCLFGSPLPYFYIAYFTILLVHRERRDGDACAVRYGKDWETYRARVPYRIIPGVY